MPTLDDPTDMVIAGEQMRSVAFDSPVTISPMLLAGAEGITGFSSIVTDEDIFLPMNTMIEINRLGVTRSKYGQLMLRASAGIVTTFGEWVWLDYTPLLSRLLWSSETFTIIGQTVTGSGSALGGCRVVVYESGRIAVANDTNPLNNPVVAETVSDGSGNFTVAVPMNVAYQLTGYLTGSPDKAGITKDTVTPSGSVLIYLRDPTSPDVGGASAYRPVGSPVVRRLSA